MFDASAKDQLGVTSGIKYQLGHYDQCLDQQQQQQPSSQNTNNLEAWPNLSPVLAKFCLIEVTIEGRSNAQQINSRRPAQVKYPLIWLSFFQLANNQSPSLTPSNRILPPLSPTPYRPTVRPVRSP